MPRGLRRVNANQLLSGLLVLLCGLSGCGDDPFTALRERVGVGGEGKDHAEFGFMVFHMEANTDGLVEGMAAAYETKPETLKGIDSLKVSDCDFTGKSLKHMKRMPPIKRLIIEKCRGFTGEFLEDIRSHEQFTELSIVDCRLQQRYLDQLRSLPNLQDLSLSHVNDEGLEHVGTIRELTTLSLIDSEIGNDGLKHLAKLQRLDYLNLFRCDMRDTAVLELRSVLPRCVIRRDEKGRTHAPKKK